MFDKSCLNRPPIGQSSISMLSSDRSESCWDASFGQHHRRSSSVPHNVYEALCKAFQTKRCSLNSPHYKINQEEFNKILKLVDNYKCQSSSIKMVKWQLEIGESSCSSEPLAMKWNLVCHLLTENYRVMRKLVFSNLEKKLIVPKLTAHLDRSINLNLLRTMPTATSATIKDQYGALPNHTKLVDIDMNDNRFQLSDYRLQLMGVVVSVNKTPTKTRQSFHSLLCISDPSLANDDTAPTEFKMHLFMNSQNDFPEVHRGDVVRFTRVKVMLTFKYVPQQLSYLLIFFLRGRSNLILIGATGGYLAKRT